MKKACWATKKTMTRRLELVEHQERTARLSPEQVEYLERHVGGDLKLWRAARGGAMRIRAGSRVGTIAAPGLEIRIRPKCGTKNLYAMLAYAFPLARIRKELVARAETDDVRAFLIALLVEATEALLRGGLRRGYLEREEDLPVLRGRLVLEAQLRRAVTGGLSLRCRHQDYTADIADNQVIRYTLERIGGLGEPAIDARLSRLRAAFAQVARRPFRIRELEAFHYDRLNQHYQPVHALCRLILAGLGAEDEAGSHPMGSFLVNMDDLFERFVAAWLSRALPAPYRLRSQYAAHLDLGGALGLRPDLVIADAAGPRLVADTKYKLGDGRPSSLDVYQALAYCRAVGVRTAVLIYPVRRARVIYEVRDRENAVVAMGMELSQPWPEVEASMRALMEGLLELAGARIPGRRAGVRPHEAAP